MPRGRLWCLPGVLQAAMNISFVVGRPWLIVFTTTETPVFPSTWCSSYSPKGQLLCAPGQDGKPFCPAPLHSYTKAFHNCIIQWGPNALPYWSRCTEICHNRKRDQEREHGQMQRSGRIFQPERLQTQRISYPWSAAPAAHAAPSNQAQLQQLTKARNHVEQQNAWSRQQ